MRSDRHQPRRAATRRPAPRRAAPRRAAPRRAAPRRSLARRPGPLLVIALLVLACAGWGWSTRDDAPPPSVASAPVASGSTPPDPGGTGAEASTPPTAAPEEDTRFAQDLVVLSAQAVLMADTLRGSDPEVAALAERIREEPDPDVDALVTWLRDDDAEVPDEASDPQDADPDAAPDLPGGISASMLGHLEQARGTNADRLFLGLLLSHDEGTLSMVEEHEAVTGNDGLRTISGSLTRTRTARVAQVTAMLERLT